MKIPPHEFPSPIQYAHTPLPAAGAIIFLFQFDTPAFHANSIIVGSLCDSISLEIGNV